MAKDLFALRAEWKRTVGSQDGRPARLDHASAWSLQVGESLFPGAGGSGI